MPIPFKFKGSYVYFARCGDLVKIGWTTRPHARLKQLKSKSPEFLFGFFVPWLYAGLRMESAFHRHFQSKRVGRFYDYYRLSESDLEEAKSLKIQFVIDSGHGRYAVHCACHPKPNWNPKSLDVRHVIFGRVFPKRTSQLC